MKQISIDHIQDIYSRELKYLKDGILNSKNPYHFFSLSTSLNNFPESRMVVMRDFSESSLRIFFNADFRSPKVKQLIINETCTALFYDNIRKMQLRFKCESVIHHRNKLSKMKWDTTPLQSRKCYMGDYTPSEITVNWEPNIPNEYSKKDPDRDASEIGYDNFVVMELIVQSVDVLELHHDGHIRFKIDDNKFFFIAP